MGKSLISNPPYNIKWMIPPFASVQKRFCCCEVPPANNANYAFILTALDWIDEKAAILLPNGVLTTSEKSEAGCRKYLIETNVIEAVISLPDSMFESTSIPTCIIVLNKKKQTQKIVMIDMRQECIQEQRDQRGQFGGASHENRVYHKTVNVLTDDGMKKAIEAINAKKDIPDFSRAISVEEIRSNDYILTPQRYIESKTTDIVHRSYADIAKDYNRIISAKNALKLTVNESLAKSLGLYETFVMMQKQSNINASFQIVGQKAIKEDFITLSKNRAEFKIENKDTERFPEILQLFLTMWKQRIMMLNNEENNILAEFRDALLPDLMQGKILTTKE